MSGEQRKICVVLVDRANYGRLKPVMQSIKDHPSLALQVIAAGTMVLERFGQPVNVVREDGFDVDGEIYIELEGSTPTTMAKSVGFATIEFASEYHRLKPDVVLIIGDRYEALAATMSAAYMNLCVAHIQGGEVSGSIDESARHAISKFSHFHFPSTERAAEYIVAMGEVPETVLSVGCPSSDLAKVLEPAWPPEILEAITGDQEFNPTEPYLLVVFHPTTTEYGSETDQCAALLEGLAPLKMQTLVFWPNIDAGSIHINKAIRIFRSAEERPWLFTLTNLMPENYLRVLSQAACALGNSSSFVRDAGFFGTPVVLVGNRQQGREWDQHVAPVEPAIDAVSGALNTQIEHGRYAPSTLYGDGFVAERIAEGLATLDPYTQKRLDYIYRETSS